MKSAARLFPCLGFLLAFAGLPSAWACMNDGFSEYSIKSEAPLGQEENYEDNFSEAKKPGFRGYPAYIQSSYTQKNWENHLLALEKELKKSSKPGFALRTSHGVALAHLGQPEKALAIFQSLEKETPGRYANAANLGTTYELLGNNELALHWIREGLRLNPKSHQGTEWLHVKILEAKLAQARDPQWLETHGVLGWNWGNRWWAVHPGNLDPIEKKKLILALHHQLHERLQFVRPPDPVVGDLLFDLASLAALDAGPLHARDLYRYSLDFHPPRLHLDRGKSAYYSLAGGLQSIWPTPNGWGLIFCFLAVVLVLVYRCSGWIRSLSGIDLAEIGRPPLSSPPVPDNNRNKTSLPG